MAKKKAKVLTVVVNVVGGCTTVVEKPKGVKVVIMDFDSKAMSDRGDNSWREVYDADKEIV